MYLIEVEHVKEGFSERELIPFYHDFLDNAITEAKRLKKVRPGNNYRVFSTLKELVYSSIEFERSLIDSLREANKLWSNFLDKNDCSPELIEKIKNVINVNNNIIDGYKMSDF